MTKSSKTYNTDEVSSGGSPVGGNYHRNDLVNSETEQVEGGYYSGLGYHIYWESPGHKFGATPLIVLEAIIERLNKTGECPEALPFLAGARTNLMRPKQQP